MSLPTPILTPTPAEPRALPSPFPYQGSKRRLAGQIAALLPQPIAVFYEPFGGSAALALHALATGRCERVVIGESLAELAALWQQILRDPEPLANHYAALWPEPAAYNRVRARFNAQRDPADLLYLLLRCVKAAVRFDRAGNFNQAADVRRVGRKPAALRDDLLRVAELLRGRAEVRRGDWRDTTADATPRDFVYLDPPWHGTSAGRDPRYHQGLALPLLTAGLAELRQRGIRLGLSYDGARGDRDFTQTFPADLQLRHRLIDAGPSSQATLLGRREVTRESLYLAP